MSSTGGEQQVTGHDRVDTQGWQEPGGGGEQRLSTSSGAVHRWKVAKLE